MTGPTDLPFRDGTIPFRGYQTWYRVYGNGEDPGRLPLLALHGGPGACHDYLEPLRELARDGRRVVFYDQLGCGLSGLPEPRPEMWQVDLFTDEVDAVREALGLDRIHLLGQSWGGMLAMEYMLTRPRGVASLTVASSPASMVQWVEEANKLRALLPLEAQATLVAHEAAGTTGDPAYDAAMQVFYHRHVCIPDPYPDFVARSFQKLADNPEVYFTMNGPSEFHVTGSLRTWDIRHRLGEIGVLTLVTSGRHDEATPAIAQTVQHGIPGAEWVVFEHSSHMAHAEEPERYRGVLSAFLGRVEAGGTSDGSARSAGG